MRIRFWGTRGTRPTPGRRTLGYGGNTACVEVRTADGDLIVLDAGSGIAELGDSLAHQGPIAAHLLISHTHWDHIQGFPFFAPAFVKGTRLTILGPAGSIKSLKSAFADQMDPTYFPLRLEQMPAELDFKELDPAEPVEIGCVRVSPHEMHHPIPTFGYRIEENGSAFVFATDNEPYDDSPGSGHAQLARAGHQALVTWAQGADLLVHDAQYSVSEYSRRVGWGHSTFDYALTVAAEAKVQKLAFFHHDPEHSDADIDALVEEALGAHRERGQREVVAFAAAENYELTI